MSEQHIIEAYSPTLNQTVREFHLNDFDIVDTTDANIAQQKADDFAIRLNQRQYLKTTDWVGKIGILTNTIS